jgi:hypothetical protein
MLTIGFVRVELHVSESGPSTAVKKFRKSCGLLYGSASPVVTEEMTAIEYDEP